MTAKLWLRISAVISLVFGLGHSLGGLSHWSPMGDNAVLRTMQAVRFDTMGVQRSYFDFFMGFGISLSVSMFVQAAVLWLIADIADREPAKARQVSLVFLLASLGSVAITWHFLFPVPALFSLVLVATLGMAALRAR